MKHFLWIVPILCMAMTCKQEIITDEYLQNVNCNSYGVSGLKATNKVFFNLSLSEADRTAGKYVFRKQFTYDSEIQYHEALVCKGDVPLGKYYQSIVIYCSSADSSVIEDEWEVKPGITSFGIIDESFGQIICD